MGLFSSLSFLNTGKQPLRSDFLTYKNTFRFKFCFPDLNGQLKVISWVDQPLGQLQSMNVVGNIPMKMINLLLTVQFFACCSLVYATLPMMMTFQQWLNTTLEIRLQRHNEPRLRICSASQTFKIFTKYIVQIRQIFKIVLYFKQKLIENFKMFILVNNK